MTIIPMQAAAQVPAPVAATTVSGEGVVTTIPMDFGAVRTLRAQRSELSDQMVSARNRREDLAEELQSPNVINRAGIEAQVRLLDDRILAIEGEIASTGRLLAAAPGNLLAESQDPTSFSFTNMRPDVTAIAVTFTIFVLTPIALATARLLWKRGSLRKSEPSFERENVERLQRLELAVDAIAVEMERVSEGQRFMTKLLAESRDRVKIEAPRG